jgi:UDP-glucose 4-epimerase
MNKEIKEELSLEGSKVLVIGGAGFIGSYIVELLLKENVKEVIIYDNFVRGKYENIRDYLNDSRCYVYPYGGDIRDIDILESAFKGVDYVFHLAAMWLLHCKEYPLTAFEVNVRGTFNVLEAARKNGVKKIIFSSSASVYGDAVYSPMKEDHPFNNKNFYGATKICGEALCQAYHYSYGIPIISLRYANVYGYRQDESGAYTGVIPTLLNKIDKKEAITIYGDGSQKYDFIYVKDVAVANIMALKSKVNFGYYNVGTGIQTSIKELVELILKLTNSDLPVYYKPYNENDDRQFVKNRVLDVSKAYEELGFKYKYSLEDGLKETIKLRNLSKKEN